MTDKITLECYRDMILEEIEDMNALIYENKIELEKLQKEIDGEGEFLSLQY